MRAALVALLVASAFLFGAATALYFVYLRGRKNDPGFWASVLALLGWVALTLGGLVRGALLGRLPFGTFTDGLLLLVWLLATSFFIVERRFGLKAGGAFILPWATAGALYAASHPGDGSLLEPILRSPWVGWHVALVFMGYAAFALAGLSGFLYLVQERELKTKRLTFMHFSLPSLGTLERLAAALVAAGFPCLTVGIVVGALWSRRVWGEYFPPDPKMAWTLATWLFYSAALLARRVWGWKGRRVALLCVAGFLAVILNYLGISFALQGIHRF